MRACDGMRSPIGGGQPLSILSPFGARTYHSAPNWSSPWPRVCPALASPAYVYSGWPPYVTSALPSGRLVAPSFFTERPGPAMLLPADASGGQMLAHAPEQRLAAPLSFSNR